VAGPAAGRPPSHGAPGPAPGVARASATAVEAAPTPVSGSGAGWRTLIGLALVAGAALLGLPAPVSAGLIALGVIVATARDPAGGVVALVLLTPFLLGEHKTVYFWVEYALVLAVLASALVRRRSPSTGAGRVAGPAALAFAAAAVVALPLDLRDLLEDLWLFRSLDWRLLWAQGIPDVSHLKYLDRVLVVALAVGLFAAACRPAVARAVVGALPALAVLVAALAAFGLLRFFDLVRTSGDYLTLSFWTWRNPDLRLTAVAWNPDYFALFLVLTVPLGAALAFAERPRWTRAVGVAAAALGTVALVFTFQRAAYLGLAVALATLAGLLARQRPGRIRWMPVLAGLVLALLAVVTLDIVVLHGRVVERMGRLTQDPNRVRLWQTALRMAADHPVLGVGTGRYAFFFREYAGALAEGFGPFWGTAHSLYLHLLAEQGLVGLASFLCFVGSVWIGAAARLRVVAPGPATVGAGILAALAGWLTYAVVQFTFRVNALVYLACILAGTVVALTAPAPTSPGKRRPWFAVAVAVALVLAGARTYEALQRPVSPGYEGGFYRWERQPEGGAARWTRGRAAASVPAQGRVLTLRFRAPIPDVERRPQLVRVWVDRRAPETIRLATSQWHALDVRLDKPPGAPVLIELEVGYTFVPSQIAASRDQRTLGVMMGELLWRDA
jgi:O-antigen ligase